MAVNYLAEACISTVREVLVFWSPQMARLDGSTPRVTPTLHDSVHIVDVFSLEVATGFSRAPHGRLLLRSEPSLAAARSWSLAKAAQLIRNDVRPQRWVALHHNNRAWGMFWAGGGLQLCRERLAAEVKGADGCSAMVPVGAEQVLALVLNTAVITPDSMPTTQMSRVLRRRDVQLVAFTSLGWLIVLLLVVAGFHNALEQQNRKLELLLERTAQAQVK